MTSAIVVDDKGAEGPWLVMVHGMSQDHRVFSSQVETFRSRFRLLLVDLPGHGASATVGGPYGHVEFTNHVRGALKSLGVEHTHYWGTHTGATVGLLLAATCQRLVLSLILEGPLIPGGNPPVVADAIERAKSLARAEGLDKAIEAWWTDGCWFDHMRSHPDRCRAQDHLAIVREFGGRPWLEDAIAVPVKDIRARLPRISTPTLIYNGAADHPEFMAAADSIESLLPCATRGVIPDSGGFPAWENPRQTNSLVSEFLASLDP